MFTALAADDWSTVVHGAITAGEWLATAPPGHSRVRAMIDRLIAHSHHAKWEVRRAVAKAAAETVHGDFGPMLVTLSADNNAQVRRAAESATRQRRDRTSTSALGEQHDQRLTASLQKIEARFGTSGRDAVKRVSEQMSDAFARELYHEVVRLLTPLAVSAERVVDGINALDGPPQRLVGEASRMKDRVAHISTVMRAMRSYAAQPELVFTVERIGAMIDDAIGIIRDGGRATPRIDVDVAAELRGEVSRPTFLQALTNLLANAVESYDGLTTDGPVTVHAISEDERIVITLSDQGCGMSAEVLGDARKLFTTSKPYGTGFGLPLVVRIVESDHDGRLELESTKGVGTTARLLVPIRRQRGRS